MAKSADHFILICSKCDGKVSAARMRAALVDDVPEGYAFRAVDCMAGCDRPTTVGFQAAGKAFYLFGDIESLEDIDALGQFAEQYQQSQTGWTSATDRPAALYTKTLARLPGLKTAGEE